MYVHELQELQELWPLRDAVPVLQSVGDDTRESLPL